MARAKKIDASDWLSHGVDFERRRLCLIDEVSDETVAPLIKGLLVMGEGSDSIDFYMHTGGGDQDAGLALYDAIKACDCHVRGHVLNAAYSMGSIIIQACDERLIAPHGALMLHIGTERYNDHAVNVRKWVKFNDQMEVRCRQIYLAQIQKVKPTFTDRELEELLRFDSFFPAEEAVRWGLCDSIEGSEDEE